MSHPPLASIHPIRPPPAPTTEDSSAVDRRTRPLRYSGAYGQPGGAGLDSLARLLLLFAADEDPQPDCQPQPSRLLSAQQ